MNLKSVTIELLVELYETCIEELHDLHQQKFSNSVDNKFYQLDFWPHWTSIKTCLCVNAKIKINWYFWKLTSFSVDIVVH